MKKPPRPRDVNQLAKMVGDIATRQIEEPEQVTAPETAASKRGKARAAALSPRHRKAIAKKAGGGQWGNAKRPRVTAHPEIKLKWEKTTDVA